MDLIHISITVLQMCGVLLQSLRGIVTNKLGPSALTIEPPPMVLDDFPSECYNFTNGNYQKMELYSPGYPAQYPSKAECIVYIQAPPGFNIELHFMEKFHVEVSDGCKYDYIELRDGPFGYSKFIARFCGEGFPVSIQTTTRFLWAKFASDDLVQYDGFKAVYEYKIDNKYSPIAASQAVCRIYMDNMALDGELNSKVFPLADTSSRDYPIDKPIDCTWEMLAEKGYRILLSHVKLHMSRSGMCDRNRIEMFDRTTSEDDRTGVYCGGNVPEYKSESNRMYLRLLGSRLSEKPVLFGRYTVFRPEYTGTEGRRCEEREFHCDGMCLSQALVCNGHVNCPESGADEKSCSAATVAEEEPQPIPLMTIVLAGVGGLIFTIVVIGICVTCRHRRVQNHKGKNSIQKQDSLKRNALEMAVNDSNNTAYQLAKQNSQQSTYYSLPRPSGHATMMPHRGSFSSKVPSEGDFGDHISDTSTYKKFLQLEQNFDDDPNRSPTPYNPGSGFTTIIEHHPIPPGMTPGMIPGMSPGMNPGMTPDLHWGYQGQTEVTSPTLAENLSKLQQYTQFTSSLPKTIPTTEPQNMGMVMDFKYDPTVPVYPATKFRIKSPETKYGWNADARSTTGSGKSLTFKNQDAETVAPDLTREIEAT